MVAISYPTVLIVEDEPIVRFYEAEVAEGAGFLTLQASNAEDALRELEGPLQVQVLLVDVSMPGSMDGIELAQMVQARWPGIKILIVSGRSDTRDAGLLKSTVFVSKPFTANQLVSALIDLI